MECRAGDDVPGNGARERAEHDARVDEFGGNDTGADRLRHMRPEDQESNKIEEGSPYHRVLRPQYASRDNGGDRVRGVMQAVEEIKGQRDHDQGDQNRQSERDGVHGSVHVGSIICGPDEGGTS
jgi:hypothetical protein